MENRDESENPFSDLPPNEPAADPVPKPGDLVNAVVIEGIVPGLVVPDEVRLQRFAEAFEQIAILFQIPACWVCFTGAHVPSLGEGTIMGGDLNAANKLKARLQAKMTGKSIANPNEQCMNCGKKIPPGKAGRKCEECLRQDRPKIILPGS